MILVTGSRKFNDRSIIHQALELYLNLHGRLDIVVGDAEGADEIAREWARDAMQLGSPVTMREFEADWNRKCDQNCYHPPKFKPVGDVLVPYCPVAGNLRNQAMVDYIVSQDISAVTLAFLSLSALNRGTKDCIKRAKRAKFEIKRFWCK